MKSIPRLSWLLVVMASIIICNYSYAGWKVKPKNIINKVGRAIRDSRDQVIITAKDTGRVIRNSRDHVISEIKGEAPKKWKDIENGWKVFWASGPNISSTDFFHLEVSTDPSKKGVIIVNVPKVVKLTSISCLIEHWDRPENAEILIQQPSGKSINVKCALLWAEHDVDFKATDVWSRSADPAEKYMVSTSVNGQWHLMIPGNYRLATLILNGQQGIVTSTSSLTQSSSSVVAKTTIEAEYSILVQNYDITSTHTLHVPSTKNMDDENFITTKSCELVSIGIQFVGASTNDLATAEVKLKSPMDVDFKVSLAGKQVGKNMDFILWRVDLPDDREKMKRSREFLGDWQVGVVGLKYTTASIVMTFMGPRRGIDEYNQLYVQTLENLSKNIDVKSQASEIDSFLSKTSWLLYSHQNEQWAQEKIAESPTKVMGVLLEYAASLHPQPSPSNLSSNLSVLTQSLKAPNAGKNPGSQEPPEFIDIEHIGFDSSE